MLFLTNGSITVWSYALRVSYPGNGLAALPGMKMRAISGPLQGGILFRRILECRSGADIRISGIPAVISLRKERHGTFFLVLLGFHIPRIGFEAEEYMSILPKSKILPLSQPGALLWSRISGGSQSFVFPP